MLVEVAPQLDVAEVSALEATGGWAVAFDPSGLEVVTLDYDARTGKLVVSTDVGVPPEDKRLPTYAGLLTYNRYWSETDGVRMALDEPEGHVLMVFDIALGDLDALKLGTALGNFAQVARAMRELVSFGWEDETGSAEALSARHQSVIRG